ncbi:MAG TPA: ACT domain-containing protein [Myxococcaceae bacterium]|nr:ACT domain-containing protein [Myxococcaceae bacterium]
MNIGGDKDLKALVRSMRPTLMLETYAFVTVPSGRPTPANLSPLASFKEPEGWSLLVTEREASLSGLPQSFWCRGIQLGIQPSLYAVGLLAAISERLARAGISINIISAYHRDYVFVPIARAEESLNILRKMAAE